MQRLGDRTTCPDSCVILKLFDNILKKAHLTNKPDNNGLVWRGAEQAVISLNTFSLKFNIVIFSAIHYSLIPHQYNGKGSESMQRAKFTKSSKPQSHSSRRDYYMACL